MPIKINSTGGGSVSIDVPSTGGTYTLTAPANNATIFTTDGGAITGNVAFTSNNVTIGGQTASPFGAKNKIINGDMRIDQRFAGAANNNIVGGIYVIDRWKNYGNAGGANKLRFQQNNTNGPSQSVTQTATGFPYYFGANVVSSNTVNAGDIWQLFQRVEGLNMTDFAWGTTSASPATLSFWVYSSIAGTHGGSITNGNYTRSYPFTYTISTANTWQYQTITIPGETTGQWYSNSDVGMTMTFSLGSGSNYSGGTMNAWGTGEIYPSSSNGVVNVVSSANGSFYLTGVQLEKGPVATPFEFRSYGTELALCQRYYEFGETTFYYSGYSTQTIYYNVSFKVYKRSVPTVTRTGDGVITSSTSGTSVEPSTLNRDSFYWLKTSGSTAIGGYWTASAEL